MEYPTSLWITIFIGWLCVLISTLTGSTSCALVGLGVLVPAIVWQLRLWLRWLRGD